MDYHDSYDGVTVVPTVGTVSKRGRLYASADCTANVVFGDGSSVTAFPINKGYHAGWITSVTNASLANTLYVLTNSQVQGKMT